MSNETIFGKVFLGGSKRIGRLPDKVASMLDSFIESGEHFLIGDCHGADLALQNYIHSKNYEYEKVTVFCSGEKCRFNVGGWEVRHIEASEELDGIEFYRKKDKVMIEECDCGFFVWDARSLGTKLNRMDLKRLGKPIFTYRSTTDEFKITRRKEAAKLKNYYVPNVPQLIFGSSAEREEFFNRKYDELTKLTGEDNVLLCDSQALFDEFLNALSNATVKEWRECLLSKKYILIDDFHWFETKNIILDELTYIFKHTNATIILGTSKPAGEYNFGETMNRFVSQAGER